MNRKLPFWFVVPALALSMMVVLVPSILTILVSFSDWDGFSMPILRGFAN